MSHRKLLLMGPRGAGKSTIARQVGARLGIPVLDTDDLCVARLNATSVTEIWARLGEPAWRAAEAAVIAEILNADAETLAGMSASNVEPRADRPAENSQPDPADGSRATADPDAAGILPDALSAADASWSGRSPAAVIALGGGLPIVPSAGEAIARGRAAGDAFVVYLKGAPETLQRRLAGRTQDRPPLLSADHLKTGNPASTAPSSQPNGRDGAPPPPASSASGGSSAADASGHKSARDPVLVEVGLILHRREPTYIRLADAVIEIDDRDPAEVTDAVIDLMRNPPPSGQAPVR